MGLMPIIITALGIFITVAAAILMVSYISYRLKPHNKPYIEIRNEKAPPVVNKSYYAIPVYEPPVQKREYRPAVKKTIRYSNESRFEVLNEQKPRYMQSAEFRTCSPVQENYLRHNIYELYSNDYNEGRFNTIAV